MSRKNLSLNLFFITIICWSASCSTSVPTPSMSAIKVEWTFWAGDYTILVANQLGLFKKYGIDVQPVFYDSSTQAIPDLAGAKLDGGLFTMSDVLLASNLVDLKGVMVSDNGGQYSIVASPGIQSVSDLRGKRIGFNLHTSSELFVTYWLLSQRLTLHDIVFVEMSPNQVTQGIPGQIDVGLVWEPYTTQAIAQGNHVIYQSAYYSSLNPKLVVFRKTLAEQHPNVIRDFLLAWDEAVNYRTSHPQESLSLILKSTWLPNSDLNAAKNIPMFTRNDNIKLFANNPGSDPSSIFFIAGFDRDYLTTAGYISNPPDINALLDSSFLK